MTQEELLEKAMYLLVETGTSVPFIIDLNSNKILNYPSHSEEFSMYEKVCDGGKYTLLGEMKEVLSVYEGYVPNILPNDWGDYLTIEVDNTGHIINMPEKYDFKEFVKYGSI